jgi:signal transduction histidine kinase
VRRTLAQARDTALLADARADMAAHLHDSVLQTLALIQRQAADPKKVAALARRQERELRQWLYGEEPASGSLVEALTEEMLDVEADHGVDVELVSVGDTPVTADLTAIVRAAGEAMVNAAKHSGADRIDLYSEVDTDLVSVYVRDRGRGFDLATVTDDRMGVRGSIIERMRRAGGRAIIKTAPEAGTEVRLELPR